MFCSIASLTIILSATWGIGRLLLLLVPPVKGGGKEIFMYDSDDESYYEWLEDTCLEDTEENRGWFECPDDDRADYIDEHSDWWENF